MIHFLLYAQSSTFANQLLTRLKESKMYGVFARSLVKLTELAKESVIPVWIICSDHLTAEAVQVLELGGSSIKRIVIIRQANQQDREKLWGLGVDDVILYPCSNQELLLRLKRHFTSTESTLDLFGAQFSPDRGELISQGKQIYLSQLERRLLTCLAGTKSQFCHREMLIERVWPVGVFASIDALDVLIRRLRIKLRPCQIEIVSRRGYGYRLLQRGIESTR